MRKIYLALLSLSLIFTLNTKLNAQAVGTYVFSPSSGTYTPLVGATASSAGADDGTQNVAIGFNFVFGGVTYTNAVISTNGAIKLAPDGTTGFATGWTNNLSNTYGFPIVGPSWDDNNATGGSIVYLTTGTAPNRTFSVEWINIHLGGGGSTTTPTGTFQLTLTESTNSIRFVYGTINTLTASTMSIGLNDLTSFLSVTPGAPATASSATANNNITSAANLTSGTTYTFLSPPPCVAPPGGGTVVGPVGSVCPGAAFLLSVTGSSFGTGLTYQWESSPDNTTWGNVAGATAATLTTSTTTNTYYRRKITCSGSDGFSTSVFVTVTAAVSTFPWTENFDGLSTIGLTSFPACWFKQNGDWRTANAAWTTYNDPRSGANYMVNAWSATNEFIWTNGFQLTAGTSYDFSFWFAGDGFTGWGAEVFYNTAQSGTGATQMGAPFVTAAVAPSPVYSQIKRTFVAPANGVYFFAIRVNATFNPWYLGFDDFRFEETPPCTPPTGLGISALTTTTATASWTASASLPANGYEWEVRTSGAGGSGAAGLTTSGATGAGVTTASVTSLIPNTSYSLYVRSVCATGVSYSPWEGPYDFRTPCNAITAFPFTETFEAASPTRSCWSPTIVSGTVNWTYGAGAGNGGAVTTAHGGSLNARHFGSNSGSVARLVSPALDFSAMPAQGAQVTFWYANQNWAGDQNELRVFYKTSAAGAWTLVPGAVYTTNVGAWTEVELMLPSSSGPGDYYVAFEGIELFGWGVAVDDVTFAAAPSCPRPTNVSALAISPSTVMVSFTSPGNAFIVEYGAPGFTPGTANTAGVGGTLALGAASPITINGLTAGTAYDFYVRRICIPGVDFSVNVKATATTLCAATNIPYVQNFETATPLIGFPTCTSVEDVNGSSGPTPNGEGGRWITNNIAQTYVSPTRSLWYIYDLVNPARGGDDWFYLQGLNLTAGTTYRVKAYFKGSDAPTWFEKFEIKYGTAAYSGAMTNLIYSNPGTTTATANPFDSLIADFTPAASGVYYIGFHNISDPDQAFLFIDDISVKVAPRVDVGITAITLPSLNCPTNGVFVQATIRNFNTVVQNFATYPVTVTGNITGAATATLTATINSGTLAPGASMDIYLSPSFNFSAGGIYNITATTSTTPADNDPETGNDAFTRSVSVNPNPPVPVITPATAQLCLGAQVQLSTQFTASPAPVTLPAVTSGAITVVVPDASAAGITHTIPVTSVPAGATVTGISVTMNMTHTWISDMVINLRAPNGNILNLFNARGGAGDNLTGTVITSAAGAASLGSGVPPFTGTFGPDATNGVGPTGNVSNVTTFAGLYSVGNGNWTLAMRDLFGGDIGTLTSWSVTITYQVLSPVVTWTPVTGLFSNATATTAYVAGTDAFSVYSKPTTTGTYVYTATATTSAGCTAVGTATVTVNAPSAITVGSIPDTVCISDQVIPLTASPVGGSWSGIGVSGSNFIPPATAVGTYTLTYSYTNSFGCASTATKRIAVKDCPERIIQLDNNAVILYPNPNNGQFNIRINSVLYSYLTMKVYSNNGALVSTRQLGGLVYGRVIPIDLTHLPGGVYMVHFYYDGGIRTNEKTFKVIIGLP